MQYSNSWTLAQLPIDPYLMKYLMKPRSCVSLPKVLCRFLCAVRCVILTVARLPVQSIRLLAVKRLAAHPLTPITVRDAHAKIKFGRVFLFDRHASPSAQCRALATP